MVYLWFVANSPWSICFDLLQNFYGMFMIHYKCFRVYLWCVANVPWSIDALLQISHGLFVVCYECPMIYLWSVTNIPWSIYGLLRISHGLFMVCYEYPMIYLWSLTNIPWYIYGLWIQNDLMVCYIIYHASLNNNAHNWCMILCCVPTLQCIIQNLSMVCIQ